MAADAGTSLPLERVLERRRRRVRPSQQAFALAGSALFHGVLVAALFIVPGLLAEEAPRFEYVPVMVVPPTMLGEPTPPPPPPPRQPPPPEPVPVAPPPPPEPDPEVPVLPTTKPPPEPATTPAPPPPPPAAAPPPAIPKREGSPLGSALGASTANAAVGVEDPNFTYGYYLDRVVALISRQWQRPPVGSEIVEARLFFRIQADGRIIDLRLASGSGSEIFDSSALRAVESASPLPPLPRTYERGDLGIHLIVR